MQIGRRIIFEKSTGKVILDMGEIQGEVSPREEITELDFIDYEFGYKADEFSRAIKYHIDPVSKEVIFDELLDPIQTIEQKIEELENQLLLAQEGLFV